MAYTASEIYTRVRDLIGEDSENLWHTADLQNWLNDGGHQIAAETWCLEGTDSTDTTKTKQYYTMSSAVLDRDYDPKVVFVTLDGHRLTRQTYERAAAAKGELITCSGTAEYWVADGGRIMLVPPHDAEEPLFYKFVADFTAVTTASDAVHLPTHAIPVLVDYMCARAWEHASEFGRAREYRYRYSDGLVELRTRVDSLGPSENRHVEDVCGWR